MIQRHFRVLKPILNPCAFYSIIISENKSAPHTRRFSTKPEDESLLNKIYLLNREEFKNIGSKEWLDRINILRAHQFSDSECLDMITRNPDVLQIPLDNLKDSIRQWSTSFLERGAFEEVIFRNPELLEVDNEIIRKRQSQLMMLCGSSKLLAQLMMENPNVMFDDWSAVLEKIDYLLKIRRFSMRDVVESSALRKTLDFIKFRFDILEKCGIYKQQTLPIHKINKYDPSQHKNPTLKNILTLNDEYFSFTVAKISVEEYNVCYDLFMAEENEESSDDDDDYEQKQNSDYSSKK